LGHRIALELICEFSSGHIVLLASKITKQGVYKSRGYSDVKHLVGGFTRALEYVDAARQ
jgi:short-subunit dehydrogenase